ERISIWVREPFGIGFRIRRDHHHLGTAELFGGRKLTGSGRELGSEGLEQFRRSKMVMIAPDAEADPEWFPYPDGDSFGG
ncbi:MAG: hypothetical protein ACKO8J_05745, partial [Candidatus Limnocylindrus sp.]